MITRNLDRAKKAFLHRDAAASRLAHAKSAPEEHTQEQGKYLKSVIYGGLDGIITTFAVVAGVAGAALTPAVVLILGVANQFADGLSMAIGDYLSTKAEREYERAERERESWEVENYPEGEMKEMVELYMGKGLSLEEATAITSVLSKNRKAWVDIMMVEELGIVESGESPLKNALATFVSFVLFGSVPLLVYIASNRIHSLKGSTFPIACSLTGVTLFVLGAIKVKFTERSWFLSGLEMLAVGGIAAAAAYGIGFLLKGLG